MPQIGRRAHADERAADGALVQQWISSDLLRPLG
jgi:hypothetical protein